MHKWLWVLSVVSASALAEPESRPEVMPLPDQQHPSWQLEWDNARPEQRQALDQFYQSLQKLQGNEQMGRRIERQEHLERLRDMTPEQRQQQFRDFVQTPNSPMVPVTPPPMPLPPMMPPPPMR